ncbi:hypothetical protein B2G71_02925 [Novosphingobium sp. PC22D]|nr:hypothetical protein B2G71_02925 [Novosphingobium sp. PC22D]
MVPTLLLATNVPRWLELRLDPPEPIGGKASAQVIAQRAADARAGLLQVEFRAARLVDDLALPHGRPMSDAAMLGRFAALYRAYANASGTLPPEPRLRLWRTLERAGKAARAHQREASATVLRNFVIAMAVNRQASRH